MLSRFKWRTENVLLFLALFLAISLRLGYVLSLDPTSIMTPWSTVKDAYAYNNNALSLLEHGVYGYNGRPSAFHPPLYGFFLAGIYSIFGLNNFLAVRLFQVLLSTFTVYVVYRIGRRVFNEETGIIAAFISAMYPFSLHFTGEIVTETLFVFLWTLSLLYLLYLTRKPHPYNFFLCGALFSLTILSRPVVAFIPFAILWLWIVCKSRMLVLKLLLFVIGLQVLIIPWSVRNYRVFGAFIPLPTNGGYTLALGATTLPYTEARVKVKEILGYDHSDVKNPALQEQINEAELDRKAKELAKELILENPIGYSKYVTKNFFKFFFNLDFSAINQRSFGGILSLVSSLIYLATLISAIVGVYFSFKNRILWDSLLLVSAVLSSALFYSLFLVGKRYRFATVEHCLIIFSAYLYSILFTHLHAFWTTRRTRGE